MIAANIARALQGKPKPGGGYLCRCPLPDHGKGRGDLHRSLSVDDGEGGRILVRCFAGCGGADVLAELARRDLLPARNGVAPATSTRPRPSPRPVEPHAPSLEIWRQAVPATGDTLTARYLRGRAITGPVPPSIRHHPNVVYPHSGLYLPAMVAAVQAPDRRAVAVQILFLHPRGNGKAVVSKPKLFLPGARLGAGAVRLAAAADILGLAEGIEDGLSAMALTGVPVWCVCGVARFNSVEIPPTVTTVHLFAQNDPTDSEARKALERAAEKFSTARSVAIRRPPTEFKDWNQWHAARSQDHA
ncbi:MAG: toprim domain-containing protein [Alphaproteobacteria bacterium]|nr:toprim domain-containing protein [Alphaproteobacteria bacterium]